MSLPVFLAPAPLPDLGQPAELTGPEGRHAVSVKRVRVGECIELVDAHGTRVRVRVTEVTGKDHLSAVVEEHTVEVPPTPRVTAFQALPKSDRAELAVDLLTQGGVDVIVPWQADRCVAKWKGPKAGDKWQAAANAAAKQSRRAFVPQVSEPVNTKELAGLVTQTDTDTLVLLLHEDPRVAQTARLGDVDKQSAKDIWLIIGPEGGVSPQEADVLQEAGAQCVRLGPEVLRTATAGFAALAAIGATTQRW